MAGLLLLAMEHREISEDKLQDVQVKVKFYTLFQFVGEHSKTFDTEKEAQANHVIGSIPVVSLPFSIITFSFGNGRRGVIRMTGSFSL